MVGEECFEVHEECVLPVAYRHDVFPGVAELVGGFGVTAGDAHLRVPRAVLREPTDDQVQVAVLQLLDQILLATGSLGDVSTHGLGVLPHEIHFGARGWVGSEIRLRRTVRDTHTEFPAGHVLECPVRVRGIVTRTPGQRKKQEQESDQPPDG